MGRGASCCSPRTNLASLGRVGNSCPADVKALVDANVLGMALADDERFDYLVGLRSLI